MTSREVQEFTEKVRRCADKSNVYPFLQTFLDENERSAPKAFDELIRKINPGREEFATLTRLALAATIHVPPALAEFIARPPQHEADLVLPVRP